LRRASKRLWLLVSVAAVVALATQAGLQAVQRGRVNELTLAGLRPGRDKISAPAKEFRNLERDSSVTDAYVWGDICMHRELRIEADADGIVKTVTVGSKYKPDVMAKCAASVMDPKRLKLLASGHGLQLGDACGRIEEIYGKAQERSPSVAGSDKLESYWYTFDGAGPDVPQVMTVNCNAASQTVTEITLATSIL
jgi:hypothetical protein